MFAQRCWLLAATACGLTVCAGLLVSAQMPVGSPPAATEELIAEKDPAAPADDKEDVVSLDGRKVAWRTARDKKWTVRLNGERQGGEFTEVRSLRFSRDGQHLAFAARSGKAWLMMLDAKWPALRFDEIEGLVFSRDGSRIAYAAKRDKKWHLVLGSEASPTSYERVGLPVFSQDGQHAACSVKRAGKWVMVLDGQEQGLQFDDIEARVFSPDGQRLAYVGVRRGKWMAVLDGKEGPPCDVLGGLVFSSDSRRFGYAGADIDEGFGGDKGRGRVVVDGEPSPQFEGSKVGTFTQAMLSGTIGPAPGYFSRLSWGVHGVSAPIFSPDGSRVAYAAHRGKDDEVMIVDGQPGPQVPSIVTEPVFSADSRHVALWYPMRVSRRSSMVSASGAVARLAQTSSMTSHSLRAGQSRFGMLRGPGCGGESCRRRPAVPPRRGRGQCARAGPPR